eukprot:TRINITY_DN19068_c0_g1_i1.p2 TRINITY_DN19068_c0_g1~~TRINITY_DN19068_c0_g1_i1.p2  ORF type:complete len:359 (-),score=38.01 TRINITY_DN19068_c0_g1_i1:1-1077(-)
MRIYMYEKQNQNADAVQHVWIKVFLRHGYCLACPMEGIGRQAAYRIFGWKPGVVHGFFDSMEMECGHFFPWRYIRCYILSVIPALLVTAADKKCMQFSMFRYLTFMCCVLMALLCTTAVAKRTIVGFVTGAAGLGDESFSDMTYRGLRKAQREFGFELMIAEPDSPGMVSNATIAKLVKDCDVVVLLGAQYNPLMHSLAPAHPELKFILIEGDMFDSPNVASLGFSQHEGSFLAGALAAMVTNTNIVGYIGGTDIPPVRSFLVGYAEGVQAVNPAVRVEDVFIGGAGDFSGFEKPGEGLRVATKMYNHGAVSYTHLTLPTKRIVQNSVVAVQLKKKRTKDIVTTKRDETTRNVQYTSQ